MSFTICIPRKQLDSRRLWKGSQDVRREQRKLELANYFILVDRPFTLLVQWIKDTGSNSGTMIDVGGGSGHIVLGLAKVCSASHLLDLLTLFTGVPSLAFRGARPTRQHVRRDFKRGQ